MQDTVVDVTSEAFAARLAALLRAARTGQGRPLRALARSSRGSFSARTLRALENGQADVRGLQLPALASLYRPDLAALLQERVPLTAGLVRTFTPGDRDGLLLAYLHLVRDLRDLQTAPSLALRRDDVEVLATSLRSEAVAVLDRLGQLMGSTVTQRRSAVAMFAAGAALVMLSTGAVAVETGLYQPGGDLEPGSDVAVTTSASMDDGDGIPEPLDGPDPLPPRPGAERQAPAIGTTPGGSHADAAPSGQGTPTVPSVEPAPAAAPTAAAVSLGAGTPTTSPEMATAGPEVRSPAVTPVPGSKAPSPPSVDVPGLDAPPVDPPPPVQEADAPGSPPGASEGDGSKGSGSDATGGTGDEAPGSPTEEVDGGNPSAGGGSGR
jgi:hypothetical protein